MGHYPAQFGPFPEKARCNAQGSYAGRGGHHPGLYPAWRNKQRADQGVNARSAVCASERESLFQRTPLRARQLPDVPRLQVHLKGFYSIDALVWMDAGEQLISDARERIDVISYIGRLALEHFKTCIGR